MCKYAMLDQPLLLPCGSTLKNRVAKAAMTENLADEHGMATARHCVLYRAWAEGGSGMLLTGNVQVDRRYLERPGNICIEGEQSPLAMERLRALAQAGSANGTQLWAQLGHAGRQSTAKVCDTPVAPSAVPMAGIYDFADAYTKDPEFFIFYRSLQAYRTALQSGTTTMVLSPSSDFFNYFGDIKGRSGAAEK